MTLSTLLLALLLAATLADHVTTNIFLKRGIGEGNPLLAKAIAAWGSTGLFLTKLALWGTVVAVDKNFWQPFAPAAWFHWGPLPHLFLAACVGVFAAVAAYNVYRIIINGGRS